MQKLLLVCPDLRRSHGYLLTCKMRWSRDIPLCPSTEKEDLIEKAGSARRRAISSSNACSSRDASIGKSSDGIIIWWGRSDEGYSIPFAEEALRRSTLSYNHTRIPLS